MTPILLSLNRGSALADMMLPAGGSATEERGMAFAALCPDPEKLAARPGKLTETAVVIAEGEAEPAAGEDADLTGVPSPAVPDVVLPALRPRVGATHGSAPVVTENGSAEGESGDLPPPPDLAPAETATTPPASRSGAERVAVERTTGAGDLPLPPHIVPPGTALAAVTLPDIALPAPVATPAALRAGAAWAAMERSTGTANAPSSPPGEPAPALAGVPLGRQPDIAEDGQAPGAPRGEADVDGVVAAKRGGAAFPPGPRGIDALGSADGSKAAGDGGASEGAPRRAPAAAGEAVGSGVPSGLHRPAVHGPQAMVQVAAAADTQPQPPAPAIAGTAGAGPDGPGRRGMVPTAVSDAATGTEIAPPRRGDAAQPASERLDRRPARSQGVPTPAIPDAGEAPGASAGVIRLVRAEAGTAPLPPDADAGAGGLAEEGRDSAGASVASGAIPREAPLMRQVEAQAAGATRQIAQAVVEYRGGEASLTLDPEELGGLRVTISQQDGGTLIHILAERADTADLMRRHADLLLRDLAESGIGQARISFGSGGDAGGREGSGRAPQASAASPGGGDGAAPAPREDPGRPSGRGRGLDMRV